jgi:hypothetical protein
MMLPMALHVRRKCSRELHGPEMAQALLATSAYETVYLGIPGSPPAH